MVYVASRTVKRRQMPIRTALRKIWSLLAFVFSDSRKDVTRKCYATLFLFVSLFPALIVLAFLLPSSWALAFGAIYILVFGIRGMLHRCPNCSWPILLRGVLWVPFPSKNCRRCGEPLP